MRKNCILLILACFLLTACLSFSQNKLFTAEKWFILLDYRPSLYPVTGEEIARYDMAILDPDNHPEIAGLKGRVILIAYVSIGEAENYRSYWEGVKGAEWIIGENPNWKGNYYVDVRNPGWRRLIIDEVIAGAVKKGFDGIFMDTIDTSFMLESEDPERFEGSDRAMADFVYEIHEKYPELLLISNNGFSILDKIGPYLNAMLSEDINMMVDFEGDGYRRVPAEDRAHKIATLKKLMEKYGLPVFIIDYVSQDNRALIKECIKKDRKLGFKPYVAEKSLDRIYEN